MCEKNFSWIHFNVSYFDPRSLLLTFISSACGFSLFHFHWAAITGLQVNKSVRMFGAIPLWKITFGAVSQCGLQKTFLILY